MDLRESTRDMFSSLSPEEQKEVENACRRYVASGETLSPGELFNLGSKKSTNSIGVGAAPRKAQALEEILVNYRDDPVGFCERYRRGGKGNTTDTTDTTDTTGTADTADTSTALDAKMAYNELSKPTDKKKGTFIRAKDFYSPAGADSSASVKGSGTGTKALQKTIAKAKNTK